MAFRMEVTYSDGRPMVVFEEHENIDLGAWELVTTYCDSAVSEDRWRELQGRALAEWSGRGHPDVVEITRSGRARSSVRGMVSGGALT